MTKTRREMVMEFHEKYQLLGCWKGDSAEQGANVLRNAAQIIHALSQLHGIMAKESQDGRYFRAHLMEEELAETLEAIADNDRQRIADGITDQQYVLEGVGITYNIPTDEMFEEVHASNMTKVFREGDSRMKDKGDEFVPPDVTRVLQLWDLETQPILCKACNKEIEPGVFRKEIKMQRMSMLAQFMRTTEGPNADIEIAEWIRRQTLQDHVESGCTREEIPF